MLEIFLNPYPIYKNLRTMPSFSFYYFFLQSSIVHTFFIKNDATILPTHYYTWKVAFTNLIHKQSIQLKL
jgi:hypothetical protein